MRLTWAAIGGFGLGTCVVAVTVTVFGVRRIGPDQTPAVAVDAPRPAPGASRPAPGAQPVRPGVTRRTRCFNGRYWIDCPPAEQPEPDPPPQDLGIIELETVCLYIWHPRISDSQSIAVLPKAQTNGHCR